MKWFWKKYQSLLKIVWQESLSTSSEQWFMIMSYLQSLAQRWNFFFQNSKKIGKLNNRCGVADCYRALKLGMIWVLYFIWYFKVQITCTFMAMHSMHNFQWIKKSVPNVRRNFYFIIIRGVHAYDTNLILMVLGRNPEDVLVVSADWILTEKEVNSFGLPIKNRNGPASFERRFKG